MHAAERILTTHAGSLPRPDDIADMLWAKADGDGVDEAALRARVAEAVEEVVRKQREAGVDLVSDGEIGKSGFTSYLSERCSGFAGRSEFQAEDVAEFPDLAMRIFATPAIAHIVMARCVGPVELTDAEAVQTDVANLAQALDDAPPDTAFLNAVSPGTIAFHNPNEYYPSHEAYLEALADLLRHEYLAITDAGFGIQIDAPDLAMSAHCRVVGTSVESWRTHLPAAIDALNRALDGIPTDQVRLHVCWGNYGGPHHRDVPLREIVGELYRARVGALYVEGANPRHGHEWKVFRDVPLPDDKAIVMGVIDVQTNRVEHPELVAERLVRLANVVGRERVVAGTDCGFSTFVRFSPVDPDVVWLKLAALAEGARLASDELW